MYENYIFDLYGTLVDIRTNENKRSLWKNMAQFMTLQGAPYTPAELRKACDGTIAALRLAQYESQKTLFPGLSPDDIEVNLYDVFFSLYAEKGITPTEGMIAAYALIYRTLSLDYVRLYDGAREVLEALRARGKRIFLLSNAQRLFTEPGMRALGIYDLFDDVFISSDIGFRKPSQQFYTALLKKYALPLKSSVMIGNDIYADARGAHDNGLASMYVHTAQSPALTGELPSDCIRLNTISDVLKH